MDNSALHFSGKFQDAKGWNQKKTLDDKDKLKCNHCGKLGTRRSMFGTSWLSPRFPQYQRNHMGYVAAAASRTVSVASCNTFQQASSSGSSMMVLVPIMLKI